MIERLVAQIRARQGPLLVVTGAGISLASGIPTFRGTDPGAVWSTDVTELATRRTFERDPVASWQWYLARFDALGEKQPNPAHHALVAIERALGDDFLLVTQNIDGLHRAAGSERLVEVHGTAHRVRCARDGCVCGAPHGTVPRKSVSFDAFHADPGVKTLPKCTACGAMLRPHVLWFDEYYDEHEDYRYGAVIRVARTAGLVLFVGTSFSVGVTSSLLDASRARAIPAWSIDPVGQRPAPHVQILPEKAENALPRLADDLDPRTG